MSYTSGGGTGLVPTALPSSFTEHIEFAAVPSAVRAARHWASEVLPKADHEIDQDLVDSVVLLVSELATNAIRADCPVPGLARRSGRGRFTLLITLRPGMVRIEAHDGASGQLPLPGNPNADGETGRGLMVIEALSERWGWEPGPRGKVVWCELSA